MPAIAVVILNWNGKSLLEKFLPSVTAFSKEASVYIIDNGSTDDSISFVSKNYSEITIIQNKQNLGFCEGYNQGLESISADYYILLNSDIEVTPNWLKGPIELMEANEKIAACQPKIKAFNNKKEFEYAGAAGGYIDKYGFPFCKGRVFNALEEDNGQYNENAQILWASGAALFIRADIYKQLKGLDSSFFAHMEEIDLCWRINNIGKEVWYCASSEVFHVGGATLDKSNPKKTFYNFRNGLALLYKNHPKKGLIPTILIRLVLDGIAGLYFLLQGNPLHTIAVTKAHFSFYGKFNFYRKQRHNSLLPQSSLSIIYNKSIVKNHFIEGIKKFSELTF